MTVYMITSPSGKKYIGITSQPLKRRMHGHIQRAKSPRNNPLTGAIRKYGSEKFKVEVLETGLSVEEAVAHEVTWIKFFNTTNRKNGYNLSPGGKYDSATGGKVFWGDLEKGPERRRARGVRAKEYVKQVWAERSDEERKTIGTAISNTLITKYALATAEETATHNAQLHEARKSIDHEKRKANQKAALIAYWTPERRAEKAVKMRALYPKGEPVCANLRHIKRRPEK